MSNNQKQLEAAVQGHTPGPWRVVSAGNVYSESDGVLSLVCAAEEANARLIAAAPEMLDALQALFEHCAMVHKHWGDSSNQQEASKAIEAGHAAIAKATNA